MAYSDQTEGIQFSTPVLAGLYGFLMSVGKGMFFFSPPLFLAFWGLTGQPWGYFLLWAAPAVTLG